MNFPSGKNRAAKASASPIVEASESWSMKPVDICRGTRRPHASPLVFYTTTWIRGIREPAGIPHWSPVVLTTPARVLGDNLP